MDENYESRQKASYFSGGLNGDWSKYLFGQFSSSVAEASSRGLELDRTQYPWGYRYFPQEGDSRVYHHLVLQDREDRSTNLPTLVERTSKGYARVP